MKFKIECKSLLLQKALENFLKDYIDEKGLIIGDEKGDIIIGKDIKKPFSKSQLLLQLEKIKHSKNRKEIGNTKLEVDMNIFDDLENYMENLSEDEENFDEKVDKLVNEFSEKLKKLIKEEYGKK